MASSKKVSKNSKVTRPFRAVKKRVQDLKSRRPHASFRLTRRRDVPRNVKLPGYISFTYSACETLTKYWRPFVGILALYMIVSAVLVGTIDQTQYHSLTDSVKQFGPELFGGNLDAVTQTVGLFGTVITGGFSSSLGDLQQFYAGLLILIFWLSIVWLLRHLLAGERVKVRDALYNSGAPIIATILVALFMIVQSLPAALGMIGFTAVTDAGFAGGGAAAMLFGIGAFLLVLLSLYWLTSSFFALMIVTLPGTYPYTAIRKGGDIVIGRRFPLLLRLLWLALIIIVLWAIVLIPILLLDNVLNSAWLPLVPVTVQLLGGVSLIFAITYIYLLYRKMIDGPRK